MVNPTPSPRRRRKYDDRSPCAICLVNPPWFTKDDNMWHGIKATMPPLALLSLAAWLEATDHDVAIVDIHVEKLCLREFKDRLTRLRPRVVGISVLTTTAVQAHLVARAVKDVDPNIVVVMGGVHAEALPEETLSDRAVDYVVRGDGEITFQLLCDAILAGKTPDTLAGLSFRQSSPSGLRVVHTPPAEVIKDLNRLPFPAWHLVPMHRYYPTIGAYKHLPAINMLMTRGCPGRCSFCNSAKTDLRAYDPARVVDEIVRLKRDYGIREIQFYDDTFTVFRPKVLEFCRLMHEQRVGVSWCAFARIDCIDDEMARAMKRAGCHQIMFGIESGDPVVLAKLGKPISLDRVKEAVRIVRHAGIEVRGAFVYGTEGETPESMQRTLDHALSLDLDLAVFNVATPYPGTQLFKWAKENNLLMHEDWTSYELGRPLINLPTVAPELVKSFCQRSYTAFYRRPRIMLRRLLAARSPRHWIDLLTALAFVLVRYQSGARKELLRDWTTSKKEDFLDFPLRTSRVSLTYELRHHVIPSCD